MVKTTTILFYEPLSNVIKYLATWMNLTDLVCLPEWILMVMLTKSKWTLLSADCAASYIEDRNWISPSSKCALIYDIWYNMYQTTYNIITYDNMTVVRRPPSLTLTLALTLTLTRHCVSLLCLLVPGPSWSTWAWTPNSVTIRLPKSGTTWGWSTRFVNLWSTEQQCSLTGVPP